MTRAVVVMGVCGAGKSTIGKALAEALGWRFIEGDSLHPPANVEKMASGVPLDDDDRRPFLINVAEALAEHAASGVVISCSALKKSYRDLIRERGVDAIFLLPMASRETLVERLQARRDHFMPISLLDSQLASLDVPGPDEKAILSDGEAPLSTQIDRAVDAIRHMTARPED